MLFITNAASDDATKTRMIIAVSDLLIPNNDAVLLGKSLLHPNPARSSPAREKSTIADTTINVVSFQNACEPRPRMKSKTYLRT